MYLQNMQIIPKCLLTGGEEAEPDANPQNNNNAADVLNNIQVEIQGEYKFNVHPPENNVFSACLLNLKEKLLYMFG